MKEAAAALAGAGLGLCSAVIASALASAFWPLVALELLQAAFLAGGLAALAAALAPAAWRERLGRRRALLVPAAGIAFAAIAAAFGPLARALQPGAGLHLPSFPLPFLALLAAPFAAAGVGLATWCGEPEGRRSLGAFVAGIGAGTLGAALLAGAYGDAPPPWAGGRWLRLSDPARRTAEINLDRGLRRILVDPRGAELALLPAVRGEGKEILVVGLANGPVLARLMRLPGARITIIESDAALARAVPARWPALARASAARRVVILGGAERWALARLRRRYDLIVLGESWSVAAYHARALSHRREYRWTREAFAAYLARLKPEGYLLAQRTGIGRVVATLREAAGLPAAEFGRRLAVLGGGGRIVSECWYSPAGLDTPEARARLRGHSKRTGVQLLYDPNGVRSRNFYAPLVRGDRARGLAFSTPLDLSPALDQRPFFDNVERLLLSPRGRALPEELEPLEEASAVRILPASDHTLWAMLLCGLALVAVMVRLGPVAARPALPEALWGGVATGLLWEAFAALAEHTGPSALAVVGARAALLAGLGAGLVLRGAALGWRRRVPAAALALLLGAAGYRLLPALLRLGPAAASALLCGAGALLGALLGRALGGALAGAARNGTGAAAVFCGGCLAAAALAALAATLAVTHFGYPLIWVLAGVALLAPPPSRLPAAGGGCATAT